MAKRKVATPKPLATIPIDPYGMRLHLYRNRDHMRKSVNAARGDDRCTAAWLTSSEAVCCTDRHGKTNDIWIGCFGPVSKMRASLTHELYHAIEYVRDFVGLQHGVDNSEAGAYLMSHLFDRSIKVLKGARR